MIVLLIAFSLGVASVLGYEAVVDFAEGIAELRERKTLEAEIRTRRDILTAHSAFMSLFDRTREEKAIRLLEYRLERMSE